jgi:hypothetical protein
MRLSLLNQYAGVIAVGNYYGEFWLIEVISFLENGDYTFFNFYSDYSDKDAVICTKETGALYICNVSDDFIPREKVKQVIDVLWHWDECLEQAYDKLVLWDDDNLKWGSRKECFTHDPKKVFELEEIVFGLDDWMKCDFKEYCLEPESQSAADSFFINFRCDPLGFSVKFLCEERRLYSIKPYIL